jgi:hypothetical protein
MLTSAPMRARMHGLGLGLLLVVATSVPALAQQPGGGSTTASKTEYPSCNKEVTKADSEAAHRKYLAGKDDYDEGKYASAIASFKAAYEKDCTKHDLLVIISRAHELDHNLPEAIRALEVYLERQPTSADAPTHKSKIENMKAKLAEERKKAAAAPTSSTTPAPPPDQGHTVYPWIVVGVGVATMAVGVVLIATTPSLPPGCSVETKECNLIGTEKKTDQSYIDRRDDAGRHVNQPIAGGIVTGIGGALVVGGLLWHFLEPTGPKESAKPKIQPQLGPQFGGLAFTGRF